MPSESSFALFHFRLRPLDIEFMKRLSKVVNIVPVIAKADTLTLEERVYFKQRVRNTSSALPLSLKDCLDKLQAWQGPVQLRAYMTGESAFSPS